LNHPSVDKGEEVILIRRPFARKDVDVKQEDAGEAQGVEEKKSNLPSPTTLPILEPPTST
jgi:hypothetical protein